MERRQQEDTRLEPVALDLPRIATKQPSEDPATVLLHAIAADLGRSLPATVQGLIERAIPGAAPGDIEAGRVVLMHLRESPRRATGRALVSGEGKLVPFDIEFVDDADIAVLVEAFMILDRWDRQSKKAEPSG